jgi:hypothetical protein
MTSETTTPTTYAATLIAEIQRLNAEALAAADLGLQGRYLKLTSRANTLEELVVAHAAKRQECGSCG